MRTEGVAQPVVADARVFQQGQDVEDRDLVRGDRLAIERLRPAEDVALEQRTTQLVKGRVHRAGLHPLRQHRQSHALQSLHRRLELRAGLVQHIQLHDLHERQQRVQRRPTVVVVQRQLVAGGDRAFARRDDLGIPVDRLQQLEHHRLGIEDPVELPKQVRTGHIDERQRAAGEPVQADRHDRVERGVAAHGIAVHAAGVGRLRAFPIQQFVRDAPVVRVEDGLAGDEDGGRDRIRRAGQRDSNT